MHGLVTMSLIALSLAAATPTRATAQLPDPLPRPDGKAANMKKPVQVYILMGQSNMLGFGKVDGLREACNQKGLYPYLVDDNGDWTVRKDVRFVRVMCSGSGPSKTYNNEWMTISGNIGPEMGIGHYVGHVTDAPVLILKSCIGNRSLGYDLLPPSADGYEGNPRGPRKPKSGGWYAGVQYDGDVAAAKEVLASLGKHYPGASRYEVAGFFWWQGDKDFRNADHAAAYEKNLLCLIESLREDFDAPDAKFVAATLGQTRKGAGGPQGQILEAVMNIDGASGKYRAHKGKVASVYSHPLSKGGSSSGHYGGNAETYMNVGEAMGKAMARLIMNSPEGIPGVAVDDLPSPLKSVFKNIVDKKLGQASKSLRAYLDDADGLDESAAAHARKLEDHLAGLVDDFLQDMEKSLDRGDYCHVRDQLQERQKEFAGIADCDRRMAEWQGELDSDAARSEMAVGDELGKILDKKERFSPGEMFERLSDFREQHPDSPYARRAADELAPIESALQKTLGELTALEKRGDVYALYEQLEAAEDSFEGIPEFDDARDEWTAAAKEAEVRDSLAAGKDYAKIFEDLADLDERLAKDKAKNGKISGGNKREKADKRSMDRYLKGLESLAGKLEKLADKHPDSYYGKAAKKSLEAYGKNNGEKLIDGRDD